MQEALHLEDEFGLAFKLDLQLSDLCLELVRVLGNTVVLNDLRAFQAGLKTDSSKCFVLGLHHFTAANCH